MVHSMPQEIYDTLTPFGKKICKDIVAPPGVNIDTSMHDDVIYVFDDVIECYRKMGITDGYIEQLKSTGGYYEPYEGTNRFDFYGRMNITKI